MPNVSQDKKEKARVSQNYECSCGAPGHQDQRIALPVGCGVLATKDIPDLDNRPIPKNTPGFVKWHCDDGRAAIFFDGFSRSHTFHFPQDYIAKV